jgi:hypothetical protein
MFYIFTLRDYTNDRITMRMLPIKDKSTAFDIQESFVRIYKALGWKIDEIRESSYAMNATLGQVAAQSAFENGLSFDELVGYLRGEIIF